MGKVKVTGIGKAVEEIGGPLYRDALQPVAKQLGKALETVGRAFNAVLFPLEIQAWKYERARDFLLLDVKPKLATAPPDCIVQQPKANVVIPALEAVALADGDVDLRELFANLVASAMDERIAMRAFPAFVDIMKQLTSDEAKILRTMGRNRPIPMVHLDVQYFTDEGEHRGGDTVQANLSLFGVQAGCKYPDLIPSYIDNLVRLGILEILATGTFFVEMKDAYSEIEKSPHVLALQVMNERPPNRVTTFVRSGARLSMLGRDFYRVCVEPYEQRNNSKGSSKAPSSAKAKSGRGSTKSGRGRSKSTPNPAK